MSLPTPVSETEIAEKDTAIAEKDSKAALAALRAASQAARDAPRHQPPGGRQRHQPARLAQPRAWRRPPPSLMVPGTLGLRSAAGHGPGGGAQAPPQDRAR